jgi:hypothetical protein
MRPWSPRAAVVIMKAIVPQADGALARAGHTDILRAAAPLPGPACAAVHRAADRACPRLAPAPGLSPAVTSNALRPDLIYQLAGAGIYPMTLKTAPFRGGCRVKPELESCAPDARALLGRKDGRLVAGLARGGGCPVVVVGWPGALQPPAPSDPGVTVSRHRALLTSRSARVDPLPVRE